MNVINEQIKEAKFIKNRVRYRTLSAKARDLIEGLINKDAAKRLNIQQALKHSWLTNVEDLPINDRDEDSFSSDSPEEGDMTQIK